MRKLLWIGLFTALGYAAFWYLTLNRSPNYPQGLAWKFGRALAGRDTPTLNSIVTDEARKNLAPLRRELLGHPGGPVEGLTVLKTETPPGSNETIRIIIFYSPRGTPIMSVTAHMKKGTDGWKIDGLVPMSH